MLIRARCEKDINNLFNRYRDNCPSMQKPTSDEAPDYRWRLSVSKQDGVRGMQSEMPAVDDSLWQKDAGGTRKAYGGTRSQD